MISNEQLIKIIKNLHVSKDKWVSLNRHKKVFYLRSAMDNLLSQAKNWAESCAVAKGIDLNSNLLGQEWLIGPCVVMRELQVLVSTLLNLDKCNHKNIQKKNERFIAKVFPRGFYESILWKNFTAEVWIEKGKPASKASIYRQTISKGQVCLVLGAGNVSSIAPLDAIYKLYHEGSVCLVKLSPVNDYLYDCFNKVFAELIQDGFLKFIKADNETGSLLCEHELIDKIHITGSHSTHDTIVWRASSREEIKERKEQRSPKLNKKITSELGCVAPAIIVPGVWSDAELKFQANQIISAVENNASFNCNAIKVLVLCKQWPQRELFLNYLRKEFKNCALRNAYYPGAKNRYEQFLKNYPQAEKFGENRENYLPWMFIPNVNPCAKELALNTESFCGILAEVPIDADNPGDFIHKAREFSNNKIWGTLSCSIFIDPKTEGIYKNEFEEALTLLRYGSIGVNCWAALSYALAATTWGAFPGHTLQDIQSGIGIVHNELMFDYPEKSVVRAPFHIWPKPVWFYDNKNTKEIAQRLFKFEYSHSCFDFMKLVAAGLKG